MDQELATRWQRNVVDEFKPLSNEEIRERLDSRRLPLAAAFENWIGDFNLATGFRNANGFNLKEVFYIGKKHWDRRGAVGVHNYMKITNYKTMAEFVEQVKDQYVLIGIDNVPGSVSMLEYEWPENTLMVFGEEGVGLTPEMISLCRDTVYIPMFGSVRSFNCGTSSGIAMYDYVSKMKS